MAEKKLTIKQQRFVDYYIETGNATEAYKLAGYACKTDNSAAAGAVQALRNIKVAAAIQSRLAEKDAERIASQDEVLRFLTQVMRGEEVEECVVVEGCGEGRSEARTIEKQVTPKERVRAAELLGKRYQLFTDKAALAITALPTIIDDIPEEKDGSQTV